MHYNIDYIHFILYNNTQIGGDCLDMNKKAQEARREYYRKWRHEHPESVRAAQVRFWTRKAQENQEEIQTVVCYFFS